MWVLKWQVNSPSNFASFFIVMAHNSSVNFKLILFYFGLNDPIKVTILRLSSALVKICHISHVIFHTSQEQTKVQDLETFECLGQISPNSYNRSVFLQILHQSSGSWDITPLYFLAKILYTLRSLSKYKFGEILREQSKVWNFALWWAPFVQIMYSFS